MLPSSKTVPHISELFQKSGTRHADANTSTPISLAYIRQHVQFLRELNHRLSPLLPRDLCAHSRIANVRGDTLVLCTDAAIWNSRIRMLEPQLRKMVQNDLGLPHIHRIEVLTLPD